ncbi:hypothetical protein Tco_1185686 [Tanacetum coccineum]
MGFTTHDFSDVPGLVFFCNPAEDDQLAALKHSTEARRVTSTECLTSTVAQISELNLEGTLVCGIQNWLIGGIVDPCSFGRVPAPELC